MEKLGGIYQVLVKNNAEAMSRFQYRQTIVDSVNDALKVCWNEQGYTTNSVSCGLLAAGGLVWDNSLFLQISFQGFSRPITY